MLNETMMCLQLNQKQCLTSPTALHYNDNESSKHEKHTTLPSYQSALTGLETMKRFFLCNELQEDSL